MPTAETGLLLESGPPAGAYMTDIIKGVVEVKSKELLRYLKENPSVLTENIELLRQEVTDLTSLPPTFRAFGADAYRLAAESVPRSEYSRLIRLMHYSNYVSQEDYRRPSSARFPLQTDTAMCRARGPSAERPAAVWHSARNSQAARSPPF
jgi:hypothetical protein